MRQMHVRDDDGSDCSTDYSEPDDEVARKRGWLPPGAGSVIESRWYARVTFSASPSAAAPAPAAAAAAAAAFAAAASSFAFLAASAFCRLFCAAAAVVAAAVAASASSHAAASHSAQQKPS